MTKEKAEVKGLLIRVSPELHKKARLMSVMREESLNKILGDLLEKEVALHSKAG